MEFDFARISLGSLTLHFYGLMYALAAVCGVFVTAWFSQKKGYPLSKTLLSDIIFGVMIGGILGGRLGYILLYDPAYYFAHPAQIPAVWNGGMSIHGGLLGGGIALFFLLKKKKLPLPQTIDLFMPALALGLAFGRIGNFVNGELPGRITDVPWGMDFGDGENRHVSSLYSAGKDLLLFFILVTYSLLKKPKPGVLTGLFLLLYGIFRFCVEFFRAPDPQIGLLALGLSLGQWLSLFVMCFGAFYLVFVQKKK